MQLMGMERLRGHMYQFLKGRNDSKLVWPFHGILTIQLLNQSKKEDHKEVTVSYLESEYDYPSRVRIRIHNATTGKLWLIATNQCVMMVDNRTSGMIV